MCYGFSRILQQVPSYIVEESELEASKVDRSLMDIEYACVGYSVQLDKKNPSTHPQRNKLDCHIVLVLSFCMKKDLHMLTMFLPMFTRGKMATLLNLKPTGLHILLGMST
uniref:DUF8204 domain-containing protein n=1 Tax=Davidia involucrata TaxID=16924 RepID=A0A5B7BFH4_DAVIN